MKRMALEFVMVDGSRDYDFTTETFDSVGQCEEVWNARIMKARSGNVAFRSLANVDRVIVTEGV